MHECSRDEIFGLTGGGASGIQFIEPMQLLGDEVNHMSKPIAAAIVGAGHRAVIYADYSGQHPEELKITAVADPDGGRCLRVASRYGLPPEACYSSAEELAAVRPRVADVVINGTMDHQHVPTTLPLIEAGYHVLLTWRTTPVKRAICPKTPPPPDNSSYGANALPRKTRNAATLVVKMAN